MKFNGKITDTTFNLKYKTSVIVRIVALSVHEKFNEFKSRNWGDRTGTNFFWSCADS